MVRSRDDDLGWFDSSVVNPGSNPGADTLCVTGKQVAMSEIIEKLKKIHPDLISVQIDCRDLSVDLVFSNGTFMGEFEFVTGSTTRNLINEINSLFFTN